MLLCDCLQSYHLLSIYPPSMHHLCVCLSSIYLSSICHLSITYVSSICHLPIIYLPIIYMSIISHLSPIISHLSSVICHLSVYISIYLSIFFNHPPWTSCSPPTSLSVPISPNSAASLFLCLSPASLKTPHILSMSKKLLAL